MGHGPCGHGAIHPPHWVGLYILFRQTKRKTEGPQHFAFPEISRENRGCLVLHSGNSRLSLSLRAGLGQNLRQNRGNRQHPGLFPGIPGFFQVYPQYTRYFADLADFGPKPASDSAQSPENLIDGFPGKIERKREGAVEKKGKEKRRGARGKAYLFSLRRGHPPLGPRTRGRLPLACS